MADRRKQGTGRSVPRLCMEQDSQCSHPRDHTSAKPRPCQTLSSDDPSDFLPLCQLPRCARARRGRAACGAGTIGWIFPAPVLADADPGPARPGRRAGRGSHSAAQRPSAADRAGAGLDPGARGGAAASPATHRAASGSERQPEREHAASVRADACRKPRYVGQLAAFGICTSKRSPGCASLAAVAGAQHAFGGRERSCISRSNAYRGFGVARMVALGGWRHRRVGRARPRRIALAAA